MGNDVTKSRLFWRIWFSVLAITIMSGCVSGKYPAPPSELEGIDPEQYEYTIGSGDVLAIFVWGYEDLSDSVPVRPDGLITTRLVEDLPASGKTTTQLAREIERKYAEFVKRPVVTVSIDSFVGSDAQQVKVIGASTQPRTVPYKSRMMLLDLMIEVGGIGEFASGNRAVLVRSIDNDVNNYSLRIDDLIRRGDITANVPLLPGDIIIIPESLF